MVLSQKMELVTNMELCKSVKYDFEKFEDEFSITKAVERLDIASMLQRAQMGILDVQSFMRPRSSDLTSSELSGIDQEKAMAKIDDLLHRPTSVMDNTFGCDRESALREMDAYEHTISQARAAAAAAAEEKRAAKQATDDEKAAAAAAK